MTPARRMMLEAHTSQNSPANRRGCFICFYLKGGNEANNHQSAAAQPACKRSCH